jgi:nitrate reductase delta subunit
VRRPGRGTRTPYKLLSVLLQYPDDELLDAGGEIEAALAALPRGETRERLLRFWAYVRRTPAVELRQGYVATFDLQRRTSLYVTFYLDGDTRKRGQALVRLKHRYRAAGLEPEGPELPDYLPAMLEFAALAPPGLGDRVLAEHRAGLELLRRGLRDQGSPYAELLEVICSGLPAPGLAERERIARLAREGPPGERVGLEPFAPPEVMPGMEARR